MHDIIHKFTNHSKQAILTARNLAVELGHAEITPEHILYGITTQKGSIGSEIMRNHKLNPNVVKQSIGQDANFISPVSKQPPLSYDTQRLLEKSVATAYINRHHYVGTEHLLAGVIQIRSNKVNEIFKSHRVDITNLQHHIASVLRGVSKFSDLTGAFQINPENSIASPPATDAKQESILDQFGICITSGDKQKEIDPVIGREDEIERLIHILSRRTKNNPILLGEAGVGKTAIVEGLAKKIVEGDVPDILVGKKIYSLDLSLMVAGTMYRGEFENRMKQLLETIKSDKNVIVFIDEIHTIVGAGAAAGSMDAANILKPALARGEVRCIGATTLDEYRKSLENDPALERRFLPIKVDEPTAEKTIEILRGVKQNYEQFHQVLISDESIQTAVDLSERYITDRFLPDKAIDLIDEAAAGYKVKRQPDNKEKTLRQHEHNLSNINQQKRQAIIAEDFTQAIHLKQQEEDIRKKYEELQNELSQSNTHLNMGAVTSDDIANIVSKMTGVPTANIVHKEKKKLRLLEDSIKQHVIGQDNAVHTVSEFIKQSRAGLADRQRPLASFIFLGPTGVGKTELAKTLATTLYDKKESFIRVDMSEYTERFNISKLIGAPAGYVGYKESGDLTEKVRHNPYSIILFDEIEKAHPDVFNLLLQVLEDGHITDASGKKINFKNCVIIMTSNIGSQHMYQPEAVGFNRKSETTENSHLKNKMQEELKKHFRPEFLNRVDRIISFNALGKNDIELIVGLQLDELVTKLKEKDILMRYTPTAVKLIANMSVRPQEGARAVRHTIQEHVSSPIARMIVDDEIMPGQKISLKAKNDSLVIDQE